LTQDQWIVVCLKIVLISGFLSLIAWVAIYSMLADWVHNSIGRTLVAKTLLIAGLFVPTILSLFFRFSRFTSHVAGWIDVTLIGLVTPVMLWRTIVWLRISRSSRRGDSPKRDLES
jgi:hypothetical protein